jgi:SAM-dependent methyltransferase
MMPSGAGAHPPPIAPAYRNKLLGQGSPRPDDELFFHLGYWDDPRGARADFDDLKAAQKRLNDRLLALSDLRDGLRVLDVGCGIGGTLATIGNTYGAMRLAGVNIDPAQLAIARASVRADPGNSIEWIAADACAVPFRDATFDRVLAVECVFHFPSRRRFFVEAARIATLGARLVLSDFVVSPALRAMRHHDPQRWGAIETTLCSGVGPWPDFPSDDADNIAIARAAGWSLMATENASRATAPSYRCFLPDRPIADPRDAVHGDPVDRAMAVMEWLQAGGLIDMVFFAFIR